ncbi:VWA domain-containing protein [Microvenator marinus]|uniref:VWA domain-containing protein n=1 Tax=Microvenator marinus TaxID=2600177 RepID=A0A5B8XLZ6_9DELT|nr:DUF5682 family protein [Microvenator marinus]QED26684.1 VWA domain-containing protein [Microvenator marinus]
MGQDAQNLEKLARAELADLVACRTPLLIGVRHHSPALAAAIPELLADFNPDVILIELPMEFEPWLQWLGHSETKAPVALASVNKAGGGLSFYPFAEFSPEFAAVKWAVAHSVPIRPCDLPSGVRVDLAREPHEHSDQPTISAALETHFHSPDFESLWDRAVEVHAADADAEALRRSALYIGWALRQDAEGVVPEVDLIREAHMRKVLAECPGKRVAMVIGSFHAPAIAKPPDSSPDLSAAAHEMVTSFIPYSFELLDSRSNYPAGIRDPMWQQRVLEAHRAKAKLDDTVADVIVQICREIRRVGHIAGVPDADAASRMAMDLAALRDLPGPGRQEVVEAIQSALARGEIGGRGRILANAMDTVMVGRERGKIPAAAPKSGLSAHVQNLFSELGLPGPSTRSEAPTTLRLEPMRNTRDRDRHIALKRLASCAIPYAKEGQVQGLGNAEAVSTSWEIQWQPGTDAMLELAGIWGVTLEQATRGAIQRRESQLKLDESLTPSERLRVLTECADCGLVDMVQERLDALETEFVNEADLTALLGLMRFFERIHGGHFPALNSDSTLVLPPRAPFLAAALRAIEGLIGSENASDAADLMEIVLLVRAQREEETLGLGRLFYTLKTFRTEASPLIQGAATLALRVCDELEPERFVEETGAWIDAGVDQSARQTMSGRIKGLLVAGSGMFESDASDLRGISTRIHTIEDEAFLERLPALREGFDVLTYGARDQLLESLQDAFPKALDPRGARGFEFEENAAFIALLKTADHRAFTRAQEIFEAPRQAEFTDVQTPEETLGATSNSLDPLTRWKLILGRQKDRQQNAGSVARALDQLYGQGQGEGSGRGIGQGGGQEDAYPSMREWTEDIEALFGTKVREEVMARAIELGHATVAFELENAPVEPSIELLEGLLSLKGSLSESQIAHLRPLIRSVVQALVKKLANRIMPALTGISTPRPTRRKGGPIDFKRTIGANLDRARRDEDGVARIVPDKIYFKTRAKRSLDWHISIVVDVSGSMEPSVIYSALMASILQGLPSVSLSFIAFNTQVIDLSHLVDDPLSLLLEVEVGGGTHIAKALKYARERVKVPNRTILALVTDFEEGWSADGMVREARVLAESGVHLLGLAALDDSGKPRYNNALASLMVAAGMPVAALTPMELAEWVGDVMRGKK